MNQNRADLPSTDRDPADERLDRMIEIAESEGLTLDYVVKHLGRCDHKTFKAFSDNPSLLPRKM